MKRGWSGARPAAIVIGLAGLAMAGLLLFSDARLEDFPSYPIRIHARLMGSPVDGGRDETLIFGQPLARKNQYLLALKGPGWWVFDLWFERAWLVSDRGASWAAFKDSLVSSSPSCDVCPGTFHLKPVDPNRLLELQLQSRPSTPGTPSELRIRLAGSELEADFSVSPVEQRCECSRRLDLDGGFDSLLVKGPAISRKYIVGLGSAIDLKVYPLGKPEEDSVGPFLISKDRPLRARSLRVESGIQGLAPSLEVLGAEDEASIRVEALKLEPGALQVLISGEGRMTGLRAPDLFQVLKARWWEGSAVLGCLFLASLLLGWDFAGSRPSQRTGGSTITSDGTAGADVSKERPVTIFVSYSHKDKSDLDSLLEFLKGLESEGAEFWVDKWSIRLGALWEPRIRKGIKDSDLALALVSQEFLDSGRCRFEIERFLSDPQKTERLTPVILSPCESMDHQWIRDREYIPREGTLQELDKAGRRRLFMAIKKHLREQIQQILAARANL